MSAANVSLMTAEEFLALPDDGKQRMLIEGQLWEREDATMTRRNRFHSFTVSAITHLLLLWLERQTGPQGQVLAGEVGCILGHGPDTVVGIDVAYFSADTIQAQTDATTMVDGAPVLAVEVLSPSDKQEEIHAKVRQYLASGTPMVWIVDPQFRTAQVHRPGEPPATFNETQTLDGGDVLPGLKVTLAEIFQR